jgi:thioesterase domain-containing protein
LPEDLALKLTGDFDEVWNMYGPTETTVWSSVYRLPKDNITPLIGKPIDNTRMYILDKHLRHLPIGVIGELYIGGDGVSRGYLNNPVLTKDRFLPDPFVNDGVSYIYKTGDLCRYTDDGNIAYAGRSDFQVKIRGYRIELGEIENNINGYKNIKQAVCTVVRMNENDTRLVGYYTADGAVDDNKLRGYLREKLPDYMIPNHFMMLNKFPLTPNGKIDRKAMPVPDSTQHHAHKGVVEPKTETEKLLHAIWRNVLRIDRISIHDNYFEIGGHSLLAAILFAEIEKNMHINLPLAILFDSPTIFEMAKSIDQQQANVRWKSLVPIKKEGNKAPLFLVHGAEGNVLIYRPLTHYIEKERPVYGLQAQGLDGHSAIEGDFKIIASRYIDEILSIQPTGPYFVGGYCLGGLIAYEMARQLVDAGKTVGLVSMIESFNESIRGKPISDIAKNANKLLNLYFHLVNLMSAKSTSRKYFLKEKMRVLLDRLQVQYQFQTKRLNQLFSKKESLLFHHLKLGKVYDRALLDYSPDAYTGNVDLFITKKKFLYYQDEKCGFGKLITGEIRVHEINCCARGTLVEPFVKNIAEILNDRLVEAENQHR